ncbi:TonB-dependent receptor [uncultured Bacteroides sp.]|uniref:SusC/RagA family TonB-linked outer membrane protein n=1 Tax=uncultured Bacteroides sp. TaxID=162156 RepID=UPI002AA82D15|nr:TonB-dependent receptor [uncultured Bacteroides sp.]
MKRIRLIHLILMMFCCCTLFAQNITVTGKVTDANAEPIIGASVLVDGTANGTITDFYGNFSLKASVGDILQISYIGYETLKMKAVAGKTLNIVMKEAAETLDEVVVVGASFKKSDLTGAVGSVSSKVLQEKPVTTISQAIQGRVAGVFVSNGARPGDDASIKIRGVNTINTSTDPIYVVDGLVMDNFASGFNSINLNDVASIEILKDASATALYGSRGSNGVVLITTKKGKNGEGKVSYDAWFGVQEFAGVPKTMNTKQLFELRKEAYVNGFKATNPDGDVDQYVNNVVMGSNTVFADYEFDAYKNNENYNWLNEVTRTGLQQNHSLSFSGGTDKGSYYLSLGYSDQKGLMEKSGQNKYTGRINADQLIKPWLKVGTNTSFTRIKDQIVDDGVMNRARNANPMLAIDTEVPTLNYQGIFDQNNFNPIRSLQCDNDRIRNRVLSANYLNINPIDGLNIRTSFSVDYVTENNFKYTPKDIYESIRYSTDGEAYQSRDSRMTWQWDNTISYDTTIGRHKINGLLGTSTTRNDRNYTTVTGRGFGTDLFSYYNIGSSYKKDQRDIGSDFITATLMSYIARVNYNYAGRYYLTATARYDGSSKFAKGHQWGVFPSFSGAWNVTEEAFMEDQHIFDQLKLRVGYGIVGNQNIDDFAFRSLYSPSVNNGQVSYVSNGRRGTEDITWEKQKQFNIGLDMAFLKDRLRFSADAFFIKNKDLLMNHSLPTTSGFNNTFENIGAIENKGVEFSLNASIVKTKDIQWNFSANLSADKNKITQLYGANDVVYNIDGDRNIQKEGNLFLGKSRNTIYIWKTGGIAQAADLDRLSKINFNGYNVGAGDLYPLDVDGNKVIDENDRVVVGSTDPKFYGGFATDFSWKGISLNAVFNYSYGAKKLSPYYEGLITSVGNSAASVDLLNRWTPDNTNAEFPRVLTGFDYNHYSASQMDFSVQKASFLRLSTLTLAYTFPTNVVNKLKLSNLRVYATGSNLFCLTDYNGYDPETGDWYPPTKMYVFGLNVSF